METSVPRASFSADATGTKIHAKTDFAVLVATFMRHLVRKENHNPTICQVRFLDGRPDCLGDTMLECCP